MNFKYFLLGVLVSTILSFTSSLLLFRRVSPTLSEPANRTDSVIEHYYHDNTILQEKNDSITVKIIDIRKEYEEIIDSIMHNDVNGDLSFFSNYIERFSNSNNRDSVENSELNLR